MSNTPIHDTFTIERQFKAGRKRAFEAWSQIAMKEKWFVGPAGKWTLLRREFDFRIDGREIARGEFSDGNTSHFDAVYLDIVDQERIVYAYRMYVNDVLLSVSLVTVEFEDCGAGSKTKFTEQGVYFATQEAAVSRRHGSEMLMDNVTRAIEGE
ncbi:ATPase [Capsulimonas corticalis]|uniref:ATPase n=1 Tax=Capsulimonas corticalis TaxID=2219043 RepID=A0A402CXW8_9BACT|nr:SRPBCC domain-containing protein [Capsulimonas corticalis]BDI32157.1 ATPase [Capsulimonas corticalis]